MARAALRGMWGVWGVGGDSPGAPPFWPWRQILRGVNDDIDLGSMADELGLTVDLTRLAPDVFTAPQGSGDGPVTTEDRFREFDAVAALLRQVSRRNPLLIAFDDAQVVDHPSLLLLRHVARSVKEERLLMVVNHRDADQTAGPLLTELLREPVTRLIALRGLDPPAVAKHWPPWSGRTSTNVRSRRSTQRPAETRSSSLRWAGCWPNGGRTRLPLP